MATTTPAHSTPTQSTIAELRQALLDERLTARALMLRTLEATRACAPEAWITLATTDALLAAADACDARLRDEGAAAFTARPLLGMPFAVKDNIDVAGLPTTGAFKDYSQQIAARHANTVQRLVDAGAIPVGKTNLDQFATGLVGTRSPYGAVPNSVDGAYVSGGSSSGSAYAVATGQVPFALGTDTAGSGRIPAGFNNLVGLKPTPGRVGNGGVMPACRSIDVTSVLALTVADAAEVLAIIEGPDARDAYSEFQPGPAQLRSRLRVGIPSKPVFSPGSTYRPLFEQAIATLRSLGAEIVEIDFEPLQRTALLLYGGPWVAERHAVVKVPLERNPAGFDPSVRSVIEEALRYSATDAFLGQYQLQAARKAGRAMWADVDMLMVPTAPGHPTRAEVAADPIGENAKLGVYTNFVNLLGWCALALPAGFTPAGMPFGVTFIGPANVDAALAGFGARWETAVALPMATLGRREDVGEGRAAAASSAIDSNAAHDRSPRTGATGLPSRLVPATRPTLPVAVVGAHLHGLPLNAQLTERGATLREATSTSARYRLFALPNTTPPKPGLLRVDDGGCAVAVEVWDMPLDQLGSFVALIPHPLGIGSLELADGRWVHGFICEPAALSGARDVSSFGGWRGYVASLTASTSAPASNSPGAPE